MFGKDEHSNCVVAARAHQTRRLELIETRRVLTITDDEVLMDWSNENGHTRQVPYALDSLKEWRSSGLRVQGRRYKTAAFAAVDCRDLAHVRTAIYLLHGVGAGFSLPYSVTRHTDARGCRDVARESTEATDPHGGHFVLLTGWDREGPIAITWGRRQRMTWRFFETYCDEAYAVVDALDPWVAGRRKGIDVVKLKGWLREVG